MDKYTIQRLMEEILRTGMTEDALAGKLSISSTQVRKYLKAQVARPQQKNVGAIIRTAHEVGVDLPADSPPDADRPMTDREIGRLEGDIRTLQSELDKWRDRVSGVMESCEKIVAAHAVSSEQEGRRGSTPGGAAGAHGPTAPTGVDEQKAK